MNSRFSTSDYLDLMDQLGMGAMINLSTRRFVLFYRDRMGHSWKWNSVQWRCKLLEKPTAQRYLPIPVCIQDKEGSVWNKPYLQEVLKAMGTWPEVTEGHYFNLRTILNRREEPSLKVVRTA